MACITTVFEYVLIGINYTKYTQYQPLTSICLSCMCVIAVVIVIVIVSVIVYQPSIHPSICHNIHHVFFILISVLQNSYSKAYSLRKRKYAALCEVLFKRIAKEEVKHIACVKRCQKRWKTLLPSKQ